MYSFYNCPAIVGEDGTTFNISNTTADYAHFNTGGDARTIIDWGDGDTTGIVSIEDGVLVLDNVWYDLSGRKLNGQPTEKGI